jgi:hypothetical protein
MAQHCWLNPLIVFQAQPYLPAISIAENTTPIADRQFAQANFDTQNTSVINADGSRQPPPFKHHIDDGLYGDIARYVLRGLAASKMGLYHVLGFPDHRQPDGFSNDKLLTTYTHRRRMLGRLVDTRRMTVSLPDDRRASILADLDRWLASPDFTLLELSSIFGSVSSLCDIAKWGKPYLYTLQNLLARAIQAAYRKHCTQKRLGHLQAAYTSVLNPRLLSRLQPLVARHVARAVYHSRSRIRLSAEAFSHLHDLAAYLRVPTNPWESLIGHLIPRDPFADTKSDASHEGLGFQCEQLKFYGITLLSDSTYRRCFLDKGNPAKIHINQLEMIAAILGFAAASTLMATPSAHHCPDVRRRIAESPPCPQWAMGEDNTVAQSWTLRNAAKTTAGQNLLRLYSVLLRDSDICPVPYRVSSADNWFADALSRPPPPSAQNPLSLAAFLQQIFHSTPLNSSWMRFQPSPALSSAILSSLSNNGSAALPNLTGPLGHFVPAASTASCCSQL